MEKPVTNRCHQIALNSQNGPCGNLYYKHILYSQTTQTPLIHLGAQVWFMWSLYTRRLVMYWVYDIRYRPAALYINNRTLVYLIFVPNLCVCLMALGKPIPAVHRGNRATINVLGSTEGRLFRELVDKVEIRLTITLI